MYESPVVISFSALTLLVGIWFVTTSCFKATYMMIKGKTRLTRVFLENGHNAVCVCMCACLVITYCLLCRYNGFMRESTFSVGLQRIATSDVDRVKEIVDATFDRVIE